MAPPASYDSPSVNPTSPFLNTIISAQKI